MMNEKMSKNKFEKNAPDFLFRQLKNVRNLFDKKFSPFIISKWNKTINSDENTEVA